MDEAEAKAQIEAALAELEAGAPFAEVAERFSDCKGNGGDIGYFSRGEMVDEFEAVVFSMRPGERSGVFRTPFGFHIAEVREARPPGIPGLDEVRERIERTLTAAAEYAALRRETQRLRDNAVVRRISRQEAARLAGKQVSDAYT